MTTTSLAYATSNGYDSVLAVDTATDRVVGASDATPQLLIELFSGAQPSAWDSSELNPADDDGKPLTVTDYGQVVCRIHESDGQYATDWRLLADRLAFHAAGDPTGYLADIAERATFRV